MRKAVILIPGIKGTKLYDANTIDNEILWQDIRFNFESFSRTELTFELDNTFYDEDFSSIIQPLHIEPLAYKEFWKKLKPDYGYKFIFPYDWRLPNEENGERLHKFMQYLIEKSKASSQVDTITHFDFVTHSMGNMPLRYYILKNGMQHINKIIFVTPPFKGAADAYSALAIGQGLFFNRDEVRKLARTLPALFELLPTYGYSSIDAGNSKEINLWDEDNWQKNLITEGRNLHKNESIKKFKANLNKSKVQLDSLSSWKDNLTPEEKARILILIKTEFKTLTNVVIEKHPIDQNPENYFDFKRSFLCKEGDGVVPNASSCCYYNEIATYCFDNRTFQDDYKHPFILKDNRIQRAIHSFLNTSLDTVDFKPNIFGRTIHRVTNLSQTEEIENGIKHTFQEIN